jgi:hypothetical protein
VKPDPAVRARLEDNLQHEMPYGSCSVLCGDLRAMLQALDEFEKIVKDATPIASDLVIAIEKMETRLAASEGVAKAFWGYMNTEENTKARRRACRALLEASAVWRDTPNVTPRKRRSSSA